MKVGNDINMLKAKEAAALLGVHVETVRRLARRGENPSFKVGKDWRFRLRDIKVWIESQQKRSAAREITDA